MTHLQEAHHTARRVATLEHVRPKAVGMHCLWLLHGHLPQLGACGLQAMAVGISKWLQWQVEVTHWDSDAVSELSAWPSGYGSGRQQMAAVASDSETLGWTRCE